MQAQSNSPAGFDIADLGIKGLCQAKTFVAIL